MAQLTIYKSSAGSGKTFTLVYEYLKLVFAHPDSYKNILAITFTNKASEEMKSRIIEALQKISSGEKDVLYENLSSEFQNIEAKAKKILSNLLHDYSNFSVCTIDSFFQRILSGLAKEISIPPNTELLIDHEDMVDECIQSLIAEISSDDNLKHWLFEFIRYKLDLEKGYSLRSELKGLMEKLISDHDYKEGIEPNKLRKVIKELKSTIFSYEKNLQAFANQFLQTMNDHDIKEDDLFQKSKGVVSFMRSSLKKDFAKEPNSYVYKAYIEDKWVTPTKTNKDLESLAIDFLAPILKEMILFREAHFTSYISAVNTMKNIFITGIVNNMRAQLQQYRIENNKILLSDTPAMLSEMINDNDAPFIYEKTGLRYHHFLLDEFQDTSDVQWKNLLPLVLNALSESHSSLIVGDAKQSIYRFRGANMKLITHGVKKDLEKIGQSIVEKNLDTNYRSQRAIIEFNNELFETISKLMAESEDMSAFVTNAYDSSVHQKVSEKKTLPGYVEVSFLEKPKSPDKKASSSTHLESDDEENQSEADEITNKTSTSKAVEIVLHQLEKGFNLRDICVLVRTSKESKLIAEALINNGITSILTSDSLLLRHNSTINFLIHALKFVMDNHNEIARAEILYYWHYLSNRENSLHTVFHQHKNKNNNAEQLSLIYDDANANKNSVSELLPIEFSQSLSWLARQNVYECLENILRIFDLSKKGDAYLILFMDVVNKFNSTQSTSIREFLDWWTNSIDASKLAVSASSGEDAIQIMTVHKSKGLEFKIVILPFMNWSSNPKSDHLLWIESGIQPYDELNRFPVAAHKELSESNFTKDFQQEKDFTAIDNLNLLYVAFTRAEEKLFVVCCGAKTNKKLDEAIKKNKPLSIQDRLVQTIHSNSGLLQNFNEEKQIFTIGEDRDEIKKDVHINKIPVGHKMISSAWQKRLSVKSTSFIMEEAEIDVQLKKKHGILLHEILAAIHQSSDINKVIAQFQFAGWVSDENKNEIERQIQSVIANDLVKPFFEIDANILAEREIILPNLETHRPDRVLINDKNEVSILDFKSGIKRKEDEIQIKGYGKLLQDMDYKINDLLLFYIQENECVVVQH